MTTTIIVPSNPADIKIIKDAVIEADGCMIQIAAHRSQIKAIIDDVCEKYPDINAKYVKRLINDYHRSTFDEKSVENSDYEALYETVFPQ